VILAILATGTGAEVEDPIVLGVRITVAVDALTGLTIAILTAGGRHPRPTRPDLGLIHLTTSVISPCTDLLATVLPACRHLGLRTTGDRAFDSPRLVQTTLGTPIDLAPHQTGTPLVLEETNHHFHLHSNAKGLEVLLLAAIINLVLATITPNTEKGGAAALRIRSEAAGFRAVVVVEGDPLSAAVTAAEKTVIGLISHLQDDLLSGIGGGPDLLVSTATATIVLGIDHHLDTLCGRSTQDRSLLAAQRVTTR
jgi:hypothetical protein